MGLPKLCLYGKCQNTSKTNEDDSVHFVPFPKLVTARTRNRVEKWVNACGKQGVNVSYVQNHHNRCFVCSTHFVGGDGPTKLNPDPIPYVPDQGPLKVQLFKNRKPCAVTDCDSVSSKEDLVTFHPFPKHHLQFELWKNALKLDKDPPKSRAFVCSKHFISGMKSDYPSHPDFIPSIFPSTSPAEVKTLRLRLREFESGYAKLKLERSCASLRKHWYECGFTRAELTDGVRRVKSQKRKQALEEKFAAEAKKRREMEAEAEEGREGSYIRETEGTKTISEIRQTDHITRVESGGDEFVIENDRAGDSDAEFDFVKVKDEPVSDSETPAYDGCNKSLDMSCVGRKEGGGSEGLMTEDNIKSEPVDEDYDKAACPGMEKVTRDLCDEMLTVHFGNQSCSGSNPEVEDTSDGNNDEGDNQVTSQISSDWPTPASQPLHSNNNLIFQTSLPQTITEQLPNQSVVFPCILSNTVTQPLYPTQTLGFQAVLPITGNQISYPHHNVGIQNAHMSNVTQPVYTSQTAAFPSSLSSVVNQPLYTNQSNCYSILGQTYQVMGLPSSEHSIKTCIPQTSAAPAPSDTAIKTVFALDPNTYRSPITEQTTFVVPKENIITLALGTDTGKKAFMQEADGSQTQWADGSQNDVTELEKERPPANTNQDFSNLDSGRQKQLSSTASVDSEPVSCQLSCEKSEDESVSSKEYQPSRSPSGTSSGTSRPASCGIESIASGITWQKRSPDCDSSSKNSVLSELVSEAKTATKNQEGKLSLSDASAQRPLQRTQSVDENSVDSCVSGKEISEGECQTTDHLQRDVSTNMNQSPITDKSEPSQTDWSIEVPKEINSKMCQTMKSISKEATLKRHLSNIGVEVTPDQFKCLLKQRLFPSGMCPSIQKVRKSFYDCGIQVEMDKYILPDLNHQCTHISNEVMHFKQRLQSMTYDFLKCGTSKNSVLCHTGCYTINTLKDLFEYVSICSDSPPKGDLTQFQEFIMTLMKIRLGLHNYDLAFRFEVEPSLVAEILTKWCDIFHNTLSFLIDWPDHEPERTEHRNQRWRLLKLRYDLLRAYDGVESMKDKWLLEQDLDDMIKICDVLNSFQTKEKKPETSTQLQPNLPEPVQYFIEETVREDSVSDDCLITSSDIPEKKSQNSMTEEQTYRHCSKESEEKDDTSMEVVDLGDHEDVGESSNSEERDHMKDWNLPQQGQDRENSVFILQKNRKSTDSSKTKSDAGSTTDIKTDIEILTTDSTKHSVQSVKMISDAGTSEDLNQEYAEKNVHPKQPSDSSKTESDVRTKTDLEEDTDILPRDRLEHDVHEDEQESADITENVVRRQQQISNVYYIDDSEGLLIGAPEFEVEICASEEPDVLEWAVSDFIPSVDN